MEKKVGELFESYSSSDVYIMSKNNFCYKVNIRNIHQKLTEKKCFFCGDCRIRTYGPFRTNGLVDRRFRPLSQITLENIVTLLLDSVDQDRQALTAEVKDALNVLMRQNYIQKKLDTYQFLTDSEREVNEAINAIEVDDRKVAQKIGSYLLTSNLIDAKYTYPHMKNQYIFEFNEYIDEMGLNRLSNNLKIQIISPLIADNYREIDFKQKAMDGKNIIIVLKDDDRYIENYRHIEKINAYLQKPESHSDDKKQEIAFNRKAESKQVEESILLKTE